MYKTLHKILLHPLNSHQKTKALLRYLNWQLTSRLLKAEQKKLWIGQLSLLVKRGFYSSTSCHYFSLPELDSMGFLLHFLRPNELFFDVGANIGAYSLLASGVAKAKSIAFEPDILSSSLFLRNIQENELGHLIQVHQIGLGAIHQKIEFTTHDGIQNHIATISDPKKQQIKIAPLDDFALTGQPILLKIDVEGYETAVVAGADKTLSSSSLKAIIMERMGLGARYGFDEDQLHKKILKYGFELADYQAIGRKITPTNSPKFGNNLYVRDLKLVEERIKTASRLVIHGISL